MNDPQTALSHGCPDLTRAAEAPRKTRRAGPAQQDPAPNAMLNFLATSAPFFAVVFLGWLAGRRGMFDASAVRILNTFAFFIATPALIIRVMSREPIADLWNGPYIAGLALAGVGQMILVALFLHFFRGKRADAAISRGQATVGPNFAFLGIPLVIAFLGDKAPSPIALGLLADNAILIPLTIGLIRAMQGGGRGGLTLAGELARGALLNPFMLSIAAGVSLSLLGLTPTGPFDRFLQFLGNAAPPTGVFALGLALAGWGISARMRTLAPLVFGKLVLHPLMTWIVLSQVLRLDPFWVAAGVLYAALPCAANVFIIAERFSTDPKPVAANVVVTTALASITYPITVWLILG